MRVVIFDISREFHNMGTVKSDDRLLGEFHPEQTRSVWIRIVWDRILEPGLSVLSFLFLELDL